MEAAKEGKFGTRIGGCKRRGRRKCQGREGGSERYGEREREKRDMEVERCGEICRIIALDLA